MRVLRKVTRIMIEGFLGGISNFPLQNFWGLENLESSFLGGGGGGERCCEI